VDLRWHQKLSLKTYGVELEVLDSTNPDHVRKVVYKDLEKTAVVVSSKSGSTVETDSQKRIFEEAFSRAGIDKTERIFIVTDPAVTNGAGCKG